MKRTALLMAVGVTVLLALVVGAALATPVALVPTATAAATTAAEMVSPRRPLVLVILLPPRHP